MKGLVCAGGEATRLGELTRVANKHLLPVGSWPMIYYPLQLLERAGVESVLLVTGKGHAGQMIDLLGDGRVAARGSDTPLLSLDLTYKVQTQPGGIAQVVGMARDFAQGESLVVVLGDNVFERSQSAAIAAACDRSNTLSPSTTTRLSPCAKSRAMPTTCAMPPGCVCTLYVRSSEISGRSVPRAARRPSPSRSIICPA